METACWENENGRRSAVHVLTPSGRLVCGIVFPAVEVEVSDYRDPTCNICVKNADRHKKTTCDKIAVLDEDGILTDDIEDSICPECGKQLSGVGMEESKLPSLPEVMCSEGHLHAQPRKKFTGNESTVGTCRKCKIKWYWNERG